MFYTNDMVFVSCRATKNDKFAIYTFVDLGSWERYQFLGNQNLMKDIPERSKVVASFTLSKKIPNLVSSYMQLLKLVNK